MSQISDLLNLFLSLANSYSSRQVSRTRIAEIVDTILGQKNSKEISLQHLDTINQFVSRKLSPEEISLLCAKINKEWLIDALLFIKHYNNVIAFEPGSLTIKKPPAKLIWKILFFAFAIILGTILIGLLLYYIPLSIGLLFMLFDSVASSLSSFSSLVQFIGGQPRLYLSVLLSSLYLGIIGFAFPLITLRLFFEVFRTLNLETKYAVFYNTHRHLASSK